MEKKSVGRGLPPLEITCRTGFTCIIIKISSGSVQTIIAFEQFLLYTLLEDVLYNCTSFPEKVSSIIIRDGKRIFYVIYFF